MITDSLFEKYYYLNPRFVDGTTRFHDLVARRTKAGAAILEIGAGPTNPTTKFLASLGPVTGLDVSDEVKQNRDLRRAEVYDGGAFPFTARSFDLCVSNFVLEHVADPATHFSEVARVLRPGGTYCFRTPNLWHYIPFVSKLLPHSLHLKLANHLRRLDGDAHDPWPTVYRANTMPALKRFCSAAGLVQIECGLVEPEPSYGRSSPLLFFPMMCYERLVNAAAVFAPLRINFLAVVQKK
jgi:SAM-dependent methyltransferase